MVNPQRKFAINVCCLVGLAQKLVAFLIDELDKAVLLQLAEVVVDLLTRLVEEAGQRAGRSRVVQRG